jgi:hypothetical protein
MLPAEMRTDCFDFLGVIAIDLFYLPPSLEPVLSLICLPVFGHGSRPMQQVYDE